jgi:predicted MFS family arabinose efflux permease
LLGGAESLIITGGMLWGLALVARERGAKVIGWIGMSMFAALAIGAPIGSLIYSIWGFLGIALASVALPALALAIVIARQPIPPMGAHRLAFTSILPAVLLPGVGFALAGITFGSATAFLTLYFAARGWTDGALAFSSFAVALIAVRVVAGHWPDRFGGARVALGCLFVQALGLALIALAPSSAFAIAGAIIAGAGFSLVFPSFGIEAVTRAPPEHRGLAMAVYNAFLDLTLGLGSPALGFLASRTTLGAVFLASALTAVLAAPVALMLMKRPIASSTP